MLLTSCAFKFADFCGLWTLSFSFVNLKLMIVAARGCPSPSPHNKTVYWAPDKLTFPRQRILGFRLHT